MCVQHKRTNTRVCVYTRMHIDAHVRRIRHLSNDIPSPLTLGIFGVDILAVRGGFLTSTRQSRRFFVSGGQPRRDVAGREDFAFCLPRVR